MTSLERSDSRGLTSERTSRSYDDLDVWKQYEAYYPPSLRSTHAGAPEETFWRWDGLDIHLDRVDVPDAKLKIVMLHGAGGYGRMLAPASMIAREHGYATVAPDLPGYGLTAVPWSRFDYPTWIACVCDLVRAERARDGLPVILFGVSLGGLLAYQVATRAVGIDGVIATTLADPRERVVREGFSRYPWLGTLGLSVLEGLAPLTDGLPLPMSEVSRMRSISNDPSLAKLVMGDRVGGGTWIPARFLRTMLTTAPAIEPQDFDRCPILVVHPGEDRMTEIALTCRFFDRLACDKRLVILEGTSHMPTEPRGLEQLQSAVIGFLEALDGSRA